MDIESLEAANQSLQADLKLAFKRIGDLQAAIEDEMESDDNDDLINRYVPSHRGSVLLQFSHESILSFDVVFIASKMKPRTLLDGITSSVTFPNKFIFVFFPCL